MPLHPVRAGLGGGLVLFADVKGLILSRQEIGFRCPSKSPGMLVVTQLSSSML